MGRMVTSGVFTCAIVLGMCLLGSGCGAVASLGSAAGGSGTTDGTATKPFGPLSPGAPRVQDLEPNDTLAEPSAAKLLAEGGFFIDGRLDSASDVDVFELGPVDHGDSIAVRINTSAEVFLIAALFDGQDRLLAAAHWESAEAGHTLTIRHLFRLASDDCALAVAAYGPRFNAVGDYEAAIVIEHAQPVPQPSAQRVLLNFGGQAAVPSNRFADLEIVPFDAGIISPQFATHTDEIAEMVLEMVRDNFTGLDVEVIASWEPWESREEISVVHVGASDDKVLGLAESVDQYNADPSDEAVIFVEAFRQFAVLDLSSEEMATALANVTTHEIGHLLGLDHTRGSQSVMDVSALLGHLVRRRSLGTFPLDSVSFPLGEQDSPTRLLQTVGGDADLLAEHLAEARADEAGRPLPGGSEPYPVGGPIRPLPF